jgi:hypothetical protein
MRLAGRSLLLTATLAANLLAACTRSGGEPASGSSFADFAAQTLTAAPTAVPSATPPPSATLPATEAPSATPSPTQTLPPTAGPSPTPTAPPLAPDDPRQGLNLAAPDVIDDFSHHIGWFEFDDPNATVITWSPGKLTVTDPRVDAYTWWSTSGVTAGNAYTEVSARVGPCSGLDSYGLAARIGGENYDRGYTIELSCNGEFRMRKFISGAAPVVLVDWTPNAAIKTGPDAQNRLGFLLKGSTLVGFDNGQQLGQAEDADFIFGNFGLFAVAADTPGLTVDFSHFSLWHFSP